MSENGNIIIRTFQIMSFYISSSMSANLYVLATPRHGRHRCSAHPRRLHRGRRGNVGTTCLRLVESNTGVGDRDHAAQKTQEGMSDRHKQTIRPLYNDI